MLNDYYSQHWEDQNQNPAGGVSTGKGFTISWQNGPLGKGTQRREPNGAFVETIIHAAMDRLLFYQTSRFNCQENLEAIQHLERALAVLHSRTQSRVQRNVEGTHEV